MSGLTVEYPGAEGAAGSGEASHRARTRPGRWLRRVVRWGVTAVLLAVLPFILLVRGGVFAHQQWGLGAWSSPAVSATVTALLLAFYAWAASRRLGAGKRLRKFAARIAALAAAAFVHFRQDDGFVHALDLRTIHRPEWRNLAAELAFRAMGFHTLRHVGTADHLHVSLRSPGQ